MKLLGIDYGRSKIGLAVSDGKIAEPMGVIRIKSGEEGIRKVSNIIRKECITEAVLGISEGVIGQESKEFGKSLKNAVKIPVLFQDETLSTKSALELSIDANIKRRKRREMEDAFSAAIILQGFIDSNSFKG
jgi:putative Holliday junction resolvase